MSDYNDVLSRILTLVKQNGITEKKLLIDTGLNTSFLTDWKAGRFKKPSYDKIQKIAKYFNVPVEFLLNGEVKVDKLENPHEAVNNKVVQPPESYIYLAGKDGKHEIYEATPEEVERVKKIIEAAMPEILKKEVPRKTE